jgi:hypothetical protein
MKRVGGSGDAKALAKQCIGLPGVVKVGDRLAMLYDAPGGDSVSHMRRSIGLAWIDLPIIPPDQT